MNMEDYKSNSHKAKKEKQQSEKETVPEKKIQPVVKGLAKAKKKSDIRKVADALIADNIGNIKTDFVIPTVKKALSETIRGLSDVLADGVDMLLYKDGERPRRSSRGGVASRIAYNSIYKSSDRRYPQDPRDRELRKAHSKKTFDYDDIWFETRGAAEIVLTAMEDVLSQYPTVSVGDLYDLADVSTDNYQVHKYGWTDLTSATVRKYDGGYIIQFPRAFPID